MMTEMGMDSTRPEESGDCRSEQTAGNRRLFWGGCALASVAFISYFVFTLQQPGSAGYTWINEVLAVAGASAAVVAVWRNRGPWIAGVGAGFAVVLTFLLLAYVHLVSSQLPSTEGVIQVGLQAPLFSLPDSGGMSVSLEEYRGKPLILIFYRGYW